MECLNGKQDCVRHPFGRFYIARSRYYELLEISKEMVDWMEKRGVRPLEACFVQEVVSEIWTSTNEKLKP